ncbi:hypothetical protein QR680_015597 [Steinernema hermaphroditum]|uniref:CCHC-type domain-containing protein n=1 Tax=Steinernema hermaphroditum TaxID=289476 RepID=A0AA39H8M6_9BILA|nr:hypothetical protein QR680_015597 [Steinernema hermaphroditum]
MKTLQTKTDNLETVYTVLGKLPNETCDKTMDKISIEQFTDIDLVLEKVDETLTKLSFAQHTKSATSDVNKTNSWNKTNAESPRFKDARQLGTCVYCKRQGHNMSQCVTVSDKQERARILRDENRCMNCAAEGHSSVNCRSLGCRSCGGKHHTSTCVNLQTYREHETSLRDTATRGWSVNHTQPMMERQKNTPTQTKLFASQVQMEPDTKKTTLNVGRLLTATVPVLKEKTKQDENVIAGRENFESDSITAACVSTTDTQDDMIEVDKLSVMEAGTDKFMGPLTVENDLINQQVVKRFSETTKKPDDDYVVRFPWKEHGSKSQLPSNYKIALRRLESETHRKRRQTTMGSLKQATPKNTTKVTTSAVEGEALLETTARKPRKRLLPNKDDGRAKDMKRSRVESTIGKVEIRRPIRNACVFCSREHFSSECRSVTTLKGRQTIVERRNLCVVCLIAHKDELCRRVSQNRRMGNGCHFCKRYDHHSALCSLGTWRTDRREARECRRATATTEPNERDSPV